MLRSSLAYIDALKYPKKEFYVKIQLFDSSMKFIQEITKKILRNDVGSISVDKERPIQRSFSFSLDNSNGEFGWGSDRTIWIDKRVKVFTGLRLRNGKIEYIPQGVFIVSEVEDSHTPNGKVVSISGQDKAFLMVDKRGKLINELTIATGTKISTAIKLIAQGAGETLFLFDNVTDTVPYELSFSSGDNRFNAISELAALAKCVVYYDVNGYLRLKKVEDLNQLQNDSPVWTFKPGDAFYAGNVRKMDEQILHNDFVTIGGGTTTQVVRHQLTVTKNNPLFANSPYTIEKIGRITYFHNNGDYDGLLTTVDQCKWRNKYELMRKLGYAERVSLNIAPHYLLEASDIIQIEDPANNVTGRYMIEKFDIPLTPSQVTVQCSKEVRVIDDWNAL